MANAVFKQLEAQLTGLVAILHHIECQHGSQLFIRERISGANAILLTQKHLGAVGNCNTGSICNILCTSADELGIHGSTVLEEQLAYLGRFIGCHEVAALGAEFIHHLVGNALIHHNRLF